MRRNFATLTLLISQLFALYVHADAYNDRAQQAWQRQEAQQAADEHKKWELQRTQNNASLVRSALRLADAQSSIQCYHDDGFNRLVDEKADSEYKWVNAKIAGVVIRVGYEAVKIDGDNCLDALFGIACPFVIAKQIEQAQKPLPEPYLAVCHVNSRNRSCRVSKEGVECH